MNRLLLLISVLLWFSCKPKSDTQISLEGTTPKIKGELVISGAYALSPLMKIWADEFMKLHPDMKISVKSGGTSEGLGELISGNISFAMLSRIPDASETDSSVWLTPVTKEGVLPIVSVLNPNLKILMERGITKDKLKKIFIENSKLTWGEIAGNNDKNQVVVYKRSSSSGAACAWGRYLKITVDKLNGIVIDGDSNMVKTVKNDPYAIGFCNAHYAYDMKLQKQMDSIIVLPIDINNNGIIDKREMIYSKLCNVQRAGYLGFFPHELCRELTIACHGKPEDTNRREFIKWILTSGQEIAVKNGYSKIRECDVKEILKEL